MKKIVLLLIASLVLVSCGRDNEPYYPESGNSKPENPYTPPTTTPTIPVTPKPTSKYAKLYLQNTSSINRYKCYVNGIYEVTVEPNSTSKAIEYYAGTYAIAAEQCDNIYNNDKVKYEKNFNLNAGEDFTVVFPLKADLVLQSNSVDDYNISINDGKWEYVCLTGQKVVLSNIDCTTYKVKFTQRNGYMFYPTVETVYIKVSSNGKTYKFNP